MSMIEKAARAASEAMGEGWREPPYNHLHTDALNNRARYVARAVIEALMEPSDGQWDGLARALMMWLDMHPKTPRALFHHLESSGVEIPQWLRDEPEMEHLDHVPSKGTRCVLIYRAMLTAALNEGEGE